MANFLKLNKNESDYFVGHYQELIEIDVISINKRRTKNYNFSVFLTAYGPIQRNNNMQIQNMINTYV